MQNKGEKTMNCPECGSIRFISSSLYPDDIICELCGYESEDKDLEELKETKNENSNIKSTKAKV